MTATTVAIIATNTNFITITVTLTTVDEFSIAVIKFKNSEFKSDYSIIKVIIVDDFTGA